jgi:hypothetical protein
MSLKPRFLYYAAIDAVSIGGSQESSEAIATPAPAPERDGFATVDKILSEIKEGVCDSTDVFVISRIFKLLHENMTKSTTADFAYFMQVFTLYPVFISARKTSKDPDAIGSYFIGLMAAKMLKEADQRWLVGVSEEHLLSLAGVHCFFVMNLRIAHQQGGTKMLIELDSTYQRIFSGIGEGLSEIIDSISESLAAPFTIGLQFAKLIQRCNITTSEGVYECAKIYDVLLDRVYMPLLIMKT